MYVLKRLHLSQVVLALLLLLAVLPTSRPVLAQDPQPDGPVYIVQEGDSLWDIAVRFRVSMDALAAANGITNPNQLVLGARLRIPGLTGIQGVLTTQTIGFGQSLRSISRQLQVPQETLIQLNHLSSPSELYVGSTLVIPQPEEPLTATRRASLAPGQSLLELAILNNTSPWSFVRANRLPGSSAVLPGDVLHLPDASQPAAEAAAAPGALPGAIQSIAITPAPLVQGRVAAIQLTGLPGMQMGGALNEKLLNIFPDGEGSYAGLQGLHAMTEPGLYTLALTGTLPAGAPYFGAPFAFSQGVLVRAGNYPLDPVLIVSPETIDPAVTEPENAEWAALTTPVTPERLWQGQFISPAPPPFDTCWPSGFGNRRSYNGSAYQYFHSGLDFCGGVGTQILAPAAGRVVFAGPLTVRGNATVIDHGWGVYTGYLHQSEILVQAGDLVQPGQLIGKVGGTGRVTGPHLHWEVWAGGVQVDPLDWLEQVFPPAP